MGSSPSCGFSRVAPRTTRASQPENSQCSISPVGNYSVKATSQSSREWDAANTSHGSSVNRNTPPFSSDTDSEFPHFTDDATDYDRSSNDGRKSLSRRHAGQSLRDFKDILHEASCQLRARQREGDPHISLEEMETLVLLTREMENLKQMMKRSQYTVEGTWSIMEKEGMLERFGQQLYDDLLTGNPRLRVFFYGVDLDEQSKALMRMLSTAVHFYIKPEVTVDMFTKAGARHRGYGVTNDIFVDMQRSFFKVFPRFVGTDVFGASEEEWRKFWKLLLELLEHGSHSPEGEMYGKKREEMIIEKLRSNFRLIAERQDAQDTRHSFVGIMYSKALELHESLSSFEALKDLRASKRVFRSILSIIEYLDDKQKVNEYLLELGARHVSYYVTQESLEAFTDAFLFACRSFLSKEWNVAMEARFQWLWNIIVAGFLEGMQCGKETMENKRAPSNTTFCIIFTDIEGSTQLWQTNPKAMGEAVKLHHRLIRSIIAENDAYEVKTVGDSFMIAAKDVLVGVRIALSIQLDLMRCTPITPNFDITGTTEGGGDACAWKSGTLRVRIGLEYCTDATATYDTIHRRYDYYGPSVNRCARIEAVACGGQILMSRQAFECLKAIPAFHDEPCPASLREVEVLSPSMTLDKRGLDHFVTVMDVGLASLKGVGKPVHLVSMVPKCLSGRVFADKIPKYTRKDSFS